MYLLGRAVPLVASSWKSRVLGGGCLCKAFRDFFRDRDIDWRCLQIYGELLMTSQRDCEIQLSSPFTT